MSVGCIVSIFPSLSFAFWICEGFFSMEKHYGCQIYPFLNFIAGIHHF